jgi:uncharacterized protein YukE
MMSVTDRRSWDDGAAEEAVTNFNTVASQLDSLITQRDQDVSRAMADYQADGVSAEYQAKEQRWHNAADQVKQIVATLRGSLQESGQIATSASQQAAQAVANIG